MADTVIRLLDCADITANVRSLTTISPGPKMIMFQVGHWTLDNASNNATFMQELEILLHLWDIDFDADNRRIMCFPHIVNICCQHVIKKFTNIELLDDSEQIQAPNPPNALSYEDAVKHDPIARGRNLVRVMRSSGQRHEAFYNFIGDGNVRGWFHSGDLPGPIEIRLLQLLHDVKTWWDSVYFMIRRLREMRPVSYYYFT
jgi:hypothetical protein